MQYIKMARMANILGIALMLFGMTAPTVSGARMYVRKLSETLADNYALCWGNNDRGQLGHGDKKNTNIGVFVHGDHTFIQLAAGESHTCGLLANGTAMCWGYNYFGETGTYTLLNEPYVLEPDFVSNDHKFTQITTGQYHTCGLIADGTALCWGRNHNGQLGISDPGWWVSRAIVEPTAVYGDHKFTQIVAGYEYTCGLLTNGDVMCWGYNGHRQLGNGVGPNELKVYTFPILVAGGHKFTQIAGDYEHTCGLLRDGTAKCWGNNDNGQLGDGTLEDRNRPVDVSGGYKFKKITVGQYHTCGLLLSDGTAMCWGGGYYGQLGDGTDGTNSRHNIPAAVRGDYKFTQITAGFGHTCGLLDDGNIMCWGYNHFGALGDETYHDRNVPTLVFTEDIQFSYIAAGRGHTCGIIIYD